MYEHSCAKAGADGCSYVVRAGSEEELKAKVVAHSQKKHKVAMTDTIYNYLRDQAQRSGSQSSPGSPDALRRGEPAHVGENRA